MKCLLEAKKTPLNFFTDFIMGNADHKAERPYLKRSISNYSRDLIMTFPMLCDNSLPPSTASMLSRANERNIVTMLELLFASAEFRTSGGGREVLGAIHKNINANMSIEDYIDSVDNFVASNESAISESALNADIRRAVQEMCAGLKLPQKSYPVNSFSERSINDYTVYNVVGNPVVRENVILEDKFDIDDLDFKHGEELQDELNRERIRQTRNQRQNDVDKAAREGDPENLENKLKDMQYNRTRQQYNQDALLYRDKAAQLRNQNFSSGVDFLQKQLLDNDIKKANEIAPSLMIVKYNQVVDDNGNHIVEQRSFIAGVKSRLISADSVDIVERIISKNKTKISFLNLIRATTGEIGLVKDFLFSIDQAKVDAKNAVKKGEAAKMWKVLENRSAKNVFNRLIRKGNDASSITTLVINQETVNILKKEYDFDIEKVNNARMIIETYNLLGLIIADESIEVAKFLYAGNSEFETQAYSYLEKETNDNSYKKVINLIGKMNGR